MFFGENCLKKKGEKKFFLSFIFFRTLATITRVPFQRKTWTIKTWLEICVPPPPPLPPNYHYPEIRQSADPPIRRPTNWLTQTPNIKNSPSPSPSSPPKEKKTAIFFFLGNYYPIRILVNGCLSLLSFDYNY